MSGPTEDTLKLMVTSKSWWLQKAFKDLHLVCVFSHQDPYLPSYTHTHTHPFRLSPLYPGIAALCHSGLFHTFVVLRFCPPVPGLSGETSAASEHAYRQTSLESAGRGQPSPCPVHIFLAQAFRCVGWSPVTSDHACGKLTQPCILGAQDTSHEVFQKVISVEHSGIFLPK